MKLVKLEPPHSPQNDIMEYQQNTEALNNAIHIKEENISDDDTAPVSVSATKKTVGNTVFINQCAKNGIESPSSVCAAQLHDYGPTPERLLENNTNILLKKQLQNFEESGVPNPIHKNPFLWTIEEVSEFVCHLPGCKDVKDIFVHHEIDGEAFLCLRYEDLYTHMNLRIGPAVKIINRIWHLRQIAQEKFMIMGVQ